MKVESDWAREKTVPTLDEYMKNGCISFGLGPIILPTLYFVGPKIPCDVIKNPDFHNIFRLVSTCGRIINDMQSFQVETNHISSLNHLLDYPKCALSTYD